MKQWNSNTSGFLSLFIQLSTVNVKTKMLLKDCILNNSILKVFLIIDGTYMFL